MLAFFFFFGFFGALFVALSFISAPKTLPSRSAQAVVQLLPHAADPLLPQVPRSLAHVRAVMDDKQFEIFSAALVIALGEGHRFHSIVGGAGDWGVDAKLINLYGEIVIVQAKFYEPGKNISPDFIRDFMGAITFAKAAYGFFVTTTGYSDQAFQTARASRGRIRLIDGTKIDEMLRYRSREIALALRDIQTP